MEVEVPADFAIPTCDHCGEEWLSVRQSQALDVVLEALTLRSLSDLHLSSSPSWPEPPSSKGEWSISSVSRRAICPT